MGKQPPSFEDYISKNPSYADWRPDLHHSSWRSDLRYYIAGEPDGNKPPPASNSEGSKGKVVTPANIHPVPDNGQFKNYPSQHFNLGAPLSVATASAQASSAGPAIGTFSAHGETESIIRSAPRSRGRRAKSTRDDGHDSISRGVRPSPVSGAIHPVNITGYVGAHFTPRHLGSPSAAGAGGSFGNLLRDPSSTPAAGPSTSSASRSATAPSTAPVNGPRMGYFTTPQHVHPVTPRNQTGTPQPAANPRRRRRDAFEEDGSVTGNQRPTQATRVTEHGNPAETTHTLGNHLPAQAARVGETQRSTQATRITDARRSTQNAHVTETHGGTPVIPPADELPEYTHEQVQEMVRDTLVTGTGRIVVSALGEITVGQVFFAHVGNSVVELEVKGVHPRQQ